MKLRDAQKLALFMFDSKTTAWIQKRSDDLYNVNFLYNNKIYTITEMKMK